ncbi:MAG: hypothetical protein ACKOWF_19595 [Chloroflexota bacterium]
MDADRFDRLTRLLSISRSRRGFAALLGAALLPAARRAPAALACDPNCAGKACGDDGCGGSCGSCPLGSICIDDLGACVADPPICRLVGESCGESVRCCDLLLCQGGICALPACVPLGGACGPGAACCDDFECVTSICVQIAPTCAPTGASCKASDCCDAYDTCIVGNDGSYTCVRDAPVTQPCAHAGERPALKKSPCCSRLQLERGRCVVNRWERCDRRNKGRRGPCERGTKCLGGKYAVKGHPVCVPV